MSLLPQFRDRLALKPPFGVNLDQGFPFGNCSFAAPLNEAGGGFSKNWANNVRRCPTGTLTGLAQWTKGKYGPSVTIGAGTSNGIDYGISGISSPTGALTGLGASTIFMGCRVIGTPSGTPLIIGNTQTGAFGLYVQVLNPTTLRYVSGAFSGAGTLNSAQDLTGDNLWCFTAGVGRGMEVWRNGVLTASQPTSGVGPSGDNYSVHFLIGGNANNAACPLEVHFAYVWPYQLSKAAILTLFRNPWIIWLPPDGTGREFPLGVIVGGGGVPPSCSISSSIVGAAVVLTWTTANTPTSATISQGVGSVSTTGGSTIISLPTTTTTYVLTVTNAFGSSTCQTTVTIVPPPPVATGCRTILHLWQSSLTLKPETIQDRFGDWDDCGHVGLKFFQGFKLRADTFNVAKSILIRDADTQTLHSIQPIFVQHNGESVIAYSFGTPFYAHMVRDEPQDLVPWRRFGFEWVYEPAPENVQTWKTQKTSHGLSGYQHIQRIVLAYASTFPSTLTVTAFDGTSPAAITLPSTGGAYQKINFNFTFNKGLLYQYSVTSNPPGAPFQIWENDCEVLVGEWGRPGPYINYPLIGGERGDRASI